MQRSIMSQYNGRSDMANQNGNGNQEGQQRLSMASLLPSNLPTSNIQEQLLLSRLLAEQAQPRQALQLTLGQGIGLNNYLLQVAQPTQLFTTLPGFQLQQHLFHPQLLQQQQLSMGLPLQQLAPTPFQFGQAFQSNTAGKFSESQLKEPTKAQQEFVDHDERKTDNFPSKLMKGILSLDPEERSRIINWLPDNRSFVILDTNRFTEVILYKFFKKSKYNSFVRKLHRWGFSRLTTGGGYDCFHHPMFRRDEPHLCEQMRALPRTLESKKAAERKACKQQEEYKQRSKDGSEKASEGSLEAEETKKNPETDDNNSTDDEQ